MSADETPDNRPNGTTDDVVECPLNPRQQTRNLLLYGSNVALVYLGAPVLYVGIMQAALCESLGASGLVANLPSTLYSWMTPLPVVVAWWMPFLRMLRPVLVATYGIMAVTGLLVVAALVLRAPAGVTIGAVVFHAAVLGGGLGVVSTFQWELIGRGVSQARRGKALSLAFGVGPALAALSSPVSQMVLDRLDYPWDFALLFAATAPIMGLAAWLASKYVVPPPATEPVRPPFVPGVFGGFAEFLSYRLMRFAVIATILIYCGEGIVSNVTLYTKQAVGAAAEVYAGRQNTWRFGFKVAVGLMLGWLTSKTNPKAGPLATTLLMLAGVGWVRFAPRQWFQSNPNWFLLSSGLLGAGELFGVYFPHYILCCSPKAKMRRNMAFASLIIGPAGFASVLYGSIGDLYGIPMSFVAALAVLGAALVLVLLALPANPRPAESPAAQH